MSINRAASSLRSTMLRPLYAAAENEIDQTLLGIAKRLADNPHETLQDWSLRISEWGIELVSCPLSEWMQGDDWCCAGYLHKFRADDTLHWLHTTICDNKASLEDMLVAYAMRNAGYGLTNYSKDFEAALSKVSQEIDLVC